VDGPLQDDQRSALVTGATGFIGGRLTEALARRGWNVRCLVRDPARAKQLSDRGFELHVGDVQERGSLVGAGWGASVAYYLVHAMGRGGKGDFEEQERNAARNFADMAKHEGVERVVYLGGLGDQPRSKHLRSRQRTAELLAQHGPPLTYFRAGMVVGAGSESYRTLRYLVQRLPAMIAPAWLSTPTQPIAIDDVVEYLAQATERLPAQGMEVEIGGPDVLSYGEMLDRMAEVLGLRPRRRLAVPLLTPKLSSLWIGLVTPVDAGVARPLIEGLSTPTTVQDGSGMKRFEIRPMGFMEALLKAVAEDPDLEGDHGNAVRLQPQETHQASSHGPIESVDTAELITGGDRPTIPGRDLLESAARRYWPFIARRLFGIVRVTEGPDGGMTLRLRMTRLALLRFGRRTYESRPEGGSITWPLTGGLLVSRHRREGAFLRLTIERSTGTGADPASLCATMKVRDFYPSLRGEGRFAWFGARLYGATQRRIHHTLTRAYLRSLTGMRQARRPDAETEGVT
jgi:uncharacterized protein YbjT (DUF2867 family)